jgi:choline-sulfatase
MANRPHIVMLMADHLRFDCLAASGRKLGVQTPHLDALADECVVFDHAYCATPLCVPTRTAIATGKWPHQNGVIVNGYPYNEEIIYRTLSPEHTTIYEQLVVHGYELTLTGVQHVHSDPPLSERIPGADVNRGMDWARYLGEHGFAAPEKRELVPYPEFRSGRSDIRFYPRPTFVATTEFDAEHYLDMWWAGRMVEKIRAADCEHPHAWFFFGWAPHPPFWVPEPYAGMYDPKKIELPPNVGYWYEGQPAHLLHSTGAYGSYLLRDEWRRTWAAYFGLVSLVDDAIGRVIGSLKQNGFWDDALVVFAQDHGDCLGAHRLFQKFVAYEESAHVPLFIKPPGGCSPGRRSQMVSHVDLAATICDYAGVPLPEGAQDSSLRPMIENVRASDLGHSFIEYNGDHGRGMPYRAVVTQQHKYIHHFGQGPDELYNLEADPYETRSLASDPAYAAIRDTLRRRLSRWMRETGDFLDMEANAEFHPLDWRRIGPPHDGTRTFEERSHAE